MVENGRTGERVDFVVESDELLRMEVTWSKPGVRTLRHAHPGMEERWEVLDGRAAFEVDGVAVEAGPGSWVIAPPGRPHLAWNPTDEPVRLIIEMPSCPALGGVHTPLLLGRGGPVPSSRGVRPGDRARTRRTVTTTRPRPSPARPASLCR